MVIGETLMKSLAIFRGSIGRSVSDCALCTNVYGRHCDKEACLEAKHFVLKRNVSKSSMLALALS